MCGIAGIINFESKVKIDIDLLKQMAEPLKYRGPDQEGYETLDSAHYQLGFAHKRLSIIDLSEKGRQPMYSASGNSIVAFNGEIYNYKDIREKLVNEGCHFNGNSDTEVLLNSYELHGLKKTLSQLDGMFAFALFDLKKEKLFIARDRFGEKPLYYSLENHLLSFSSDIRSFDALPIAKNIDYQALGNYFSEMCTPIENSIWKEIRKLPPAHYITYTKEQFSIDEYWSLSYKSKTKMSLNEVVDESEKKLEGAVASRLVSDVPIGCFLSGGIDSSLVSLYAAKNYSGRLKTFSVGFEFEKFNELPYAKTVAEKIDSEHYEIVLNPKDVSIIDSLLEEYGEPFADSSQIPTYMVSKFASKEVKVALGGDGGDELFAGYATYNQGKRMQFWHEKKFLLPLLNLAQKHPKMQYLAGVMQKDPKVLGSALYRSMGFSQADLKKLLPNQPEISDYVEIENSKAIERALENTNTVFDTILHASIKTRMVNDYFVKTDRAAMYSSLELRTPFVSKDLAEWAATLPYNYLLNGNINKYILKKIAEKHFSKDFIYREKQGFGIPIGEWMKSDLRDHFKEVIFDKQSLIPLNYQFIEELYHEHLVGIQDHTHKLWIIYVLHKWVKRQ